MKRLLLLLAICAACKQQDAALLVTISGPFGVPSNADKLSMDVFDGALVRLPENDRNPPPVTALASTGAAWSLFAPGFRSMPSAPFASMALPWILFLTPEATWTPSPPPTSR